MAGDDWKQLAQSYAKAFAPQPDDASSRPDRLRAAIEHRLHLAFTQLFMTRRSHRDNELPKARPWMLMLLAGAPITLAVDLVRRVVPAVDRIVDDRARRRRQRWFARHMGGRVAEYAPVERFTR